MSAAPSSPQPATTAEDIASVVPSWARRLVATNPNSDWVPMAEFIRGGYLPVCRELAYRRARHYNERVWKALEKAGHRGGLLDAGVYAAQPGELACQPHDPLDKGAPVYISKRRFIIQTLGFLPRIRGLQP